jgi:hypothetical protein
VSAAAGGSLLASLAQMLPPPWSSAGCILAPAVSSGLMWLWPRLRRWLERREIQVAINRYKELLRRPDNGLTDTTCDEIEACIQHATIGLVREDLFLPTCSASSPPRVSDAGVADSFTLPLPAALPSGIKMVGDHAAGDPIAAGLPPAASSSARQGAKN